MHSTAIVLAAGEGTRMRSKHPKVAFRVLGVPLVRYVVDAARTAGADRVVVVTGHGAEEVEALLDGVEFVRQTVQLGTGHAVACVDEALGGLSGPVIVLAGDVPLIRPETISRLIQTQLTTGAACVVLTADFQNPAGYGRIVRDESGAVVAIVEDKDLSADQRSIRECNTGVYCFDGAALSERLGRLERSNAQGEYYLTDVVSLLREDGLAVEALSSDDPDETHGVNSRVQLAEVGRVLQRRINERHMLAGVTMTDPGLVWVGPRVTIGIDVTLEPMTFLFGETSIGDDCRIGPDSRLVDVTVGPGSVVDSSIVEGATLGANVRVGPRAYVRPGTVLADGAKVGTSVEVKNARIGAGSKVPHLSYIGDAEVGEGVNIGAGTITCNYDGRRKHTTVIGDGAFIGSDTMLIAPVRIGKGAVTGAGSSIAHDVPDDALAVERSEQRTIEGWAARTREQESTRE
jgi:bifunctional UDP-N-acetylglucosamine pyrophosphorylase/glucosamine-1-phosphate N-acetyltransferase